MHHVQVNVVDTELCEAGVKGATQGIRREVLVPYLGGQMQLLSRETRGRNCGAYGFFVLVHLGGVDVSVSELPRTFNYWLATSARHTKCAKSEAGQFNSLCLQSFHGCSPKLVLVCGASRRSVQEDNLPFFDY
jgi:hypothetical protein